MRVQLIVTKANGSSAPEEYTFSKDTITLGRDPANDLHLPGFGRAVSGSHAEITCSGTVCELVDLNSVNGTHLKGKQLQPGRSYRLQDGDQFRIMDYEIRFVVLADSVPVSTGPTGSAGDGGENPFSEAATQLAEGLRRLCRDYGQTPGRSREALQEAVGAALGDMKEHEAVVLMAEVLRTPGAPSLPLEATATHTRADKLVTMILQNVTELAKTRRHFQYELFDWTPPRRREFDDADALRGHLFDASISEEDADRRIADLSMELSKLKVHYMAMLKGYRACIFEGTQELLNALDPEALEEQLMHAHPLYRYMPLLGTIQVVRTLRQNHHELASEGWGSAERKIFWPAFEKAYQNVMNSAQEHALEKKRP